jgi:hypothetical protein
MATSKKKKKKVIKASNRKEHNKPVTKLGAILHEREIRQDLFSKMIWEQTGEFVQYPVLNRLVTGKNRNPTMRVIKAIAVTLGVSIDELCEYEFDK